MRKDKEQAVALRREGKSYSEISRIIGAPKSTLAYWFKDLGWSTELREELSSLAREKAAARMYLLTEKAKQKRHQLYSHYRELARSTFPVHISDNLFIAGLTIYWGEGDNKLENGIIRVVNTDPIMIKLFYRFLKKYLPELGAKVKLYLILYPDLDDEACKVYWSNQVGVPTERFFKTQYINGRTPTKRLAYGIGGIIVSSRAYKEMLLYWLALLKTIQE